VAHEGSTTRRLIALTRGNLRNSHVYITQHHDFFPEECYGESTTGEGAGKKIRLIVDGLAQAVETDIAKRRDTGRPRNFFRRRAWVGRFFRHHGLREGDVVAIERLDRFVYRIYPLESRSAEGVSGTSRAHQREKAHRQPMLFEGPAEDNQPGIQAGFGDTASGRNRREPLHRWVPWIAGFSGSFVAEVLDRLDCLDPRSVTVLDPFAGVGTTLVEGLKRGYNVIGFEINPYAALACDVKLGSLRCKLKPLGDAISQLARLADASSKGKVHAKSEAPSSFKSRTPFFSLAVEHDVLLLQDFIAEQKNSFLSKAMKVALGAVMVSFSNYSYEPSLSTRSAVGKKPVTYADVFGIFRDKLSEIQADISHFRQHMKRFAYRPEARIYQHSYLNHAGLLAPDSIDVVVTSPPYLNNYHYIRNTRPQLHWLGLVNGNGDLKRLEKENFGQFWQTVRSGPPIQLSFRFPKLQQVLSAIRKRNPDKGVYGGIGWANYAAAYFNDCDRFFRITRRIMKPGGLVVVVIGNNIVQGIHIETDQFLAQIAERHGLKVDGMHRVRKKRTGSSIVNSSVRAGMTRVATPLYETAVELRVPK
jgi:DNA modification methylase